MTTGLKKEHIDALRDMGWSEETIKLTLTLIKKKRDADLAREGERHGG